MVKALTSKNFSSGHAEYLEIYDGVKTGVEFTNSFFLSCAFFAVCILCLCMVIGQGHKSKKDFSPGFRGTCPSTACHLVVISSKPVDFFFSLTYLPLESVCSPHIPNKPVILEVGNEHDSENNL